MAQQPHTGLAELPPHSTGAVSSTLRGTEMTFLILLAALNVLFPLGLYVIGQPAPWDAFYGEQSPINWFSSVQCAVLAVAGLAVWAVTRVGARSGSDPVGRSWHWLVLGLGFGFLSFDEQFMIHENVREEILKPRDMFTGIPLLYPGDVVLLAYVVAGMVLALALYGDLRRHRAPLLLFGAALGLIGFITVQDALNLRVLKSPAVRHFQIVAEETGEVWAQALFGFSLITLFFRKLRLLLAGVARGG